MMVYKLGRFYWHRINLVPGSQRVTKCLTTEVEHPFRIGQSYALRFFGEWGIVVGKWIGYHNSEDDALMAGMDAREDDLLDEDGGLAERFQRQAARRKVAASAQDLDDEWTVVNALDLLDGQ